MNKPYLTFEELRTISNAEPVSQAILAKAQAIKLTRNCAHLVTIMAVISFLINEDGSVLAQPRLIKIVDEHDPVVTPMENIKDLIDKFNAAIDAETPDNSIIGNHHGVE